MAALDLKAIDESLGLNVEKRGVVVSFCGQSKKFEGPKEGKEGVKVTRFCNNFILFLPSFSS